MGFIVELIIAIVILIGFGIYKLYNRNSDYWKKRGVVEGKLKEGAFQIFCNLFTKKKNFIEYDVDRYNSLGNEPFGGIVEFGKPGVFLKDPELIKQVLVKDFDHFVDRRKVELASEKTLMKMMTSLEGQEWKNVRGSVSPTFTTGKIRRMFEHFNSCGILLADFIKSKPVGAPQSRDVVIKEFVSRYLIDVIGATAFGIDTSSLKDPNSVFYKMAKRNSEVQMKTIFKSLLATTFPFLTKFGLRITDATTFDFFEEIIKTALKTRAQSGEKREDFLQLMIEARKGELKTEEAELDAFEKDAQLSKPSKVNLSDDIILAQSLLFFVAGLDTASSLICFAYYLLAVHQDIQEKLYKEVRAAMEPNNGKLDYDSVNRMEYMDKFISEILRKYPTGTRIERRCTQDYKIPGTDVVIEKDVIAVISVLGIHRDPNYYPDPEKFDPERFTPEEKQARNQYIYMPFGQGPRNCIGMRFALMEAKVAIAYVVYNFLIEPSETTPVPIKVDPSIGIRPDTELELRFKERSHK